MSSAAGAAAAHAQVRAAQHSSGTQESRAAQPTRAPFVDDQGREYQRSIDPKTGDLLLRHHSKARAEGGAGFATLDIEIRIRRDGTATRTVSQRLDVPTGSFQQSRTVTSFDAKGNITRETLDAIARQGAIEAGEHTEVSFSGGQPVHRESRYTRRQTEQQKSGGHAEMTQITTGVWSNGGAPIDDSVVPAVTFDETTKITTPGAGITKNHPSIVSYQRTGSGTAEQLQWDPMRVTVRWIGGGDDYIERVLEFDLNARGEPVDPSRPRVISFTNNEDFSDKLMMQARVWGGFTSSMAGVVGWNLLRTRFAQAGRAMIWTGFGIGMAEVGANSHAVATRRNDANGVALAMSVYDAGWLGLLGLAANGRMAGGAAASTLVQRLGVSSLAATGTYGLARASEADIGAPTLDSPVVVGKAADLQRFTPVGGQPRVSGAGLGASAMRLQPFDQPFAVEPLGVAAEALSFEGL